MLSVKPFLNMCVRKTQLGPNGENGGRQLGAPVPHGESRQRSYRAESTVLVRSLALSSFCWPHGLWTASPIPKDAIAVSDRRKLKNFFCLPYVANGWSICNMNIVSPWRPFCRVCFSARFHQLNFDKGISGIEIYVNHTRSSVLLIEF